MKRLALFGLLAGCLALLLLHVRPPGAAEPPPRGPDQRPSEWAFLQRAFPYGRWDADAYRAAVAQAQALRAASKRGAALGAWQFAGPSNVGGRVVDVAFDPANPRVVYAAAATGGVFQSTDTGNTWRPIFDDQAVLNIGDLAVDPTDPQVLYVGTGEANGGQNNFLGGGLYKSSDGGDTWQFVGLENTDAIARILVDPSNPQRVFVAAVGAYYAPSPERGVYRSDDGGQTWGDPVLFVSDSTGAIDLVMHPTDPSILYAAMWERVRGLQTSHFAGPTSGLYKSTDGGDTWQRLGGGLPDPATQPVGRIGLAISETNPDVLYALYTDGFFYVGLYRSDDGGQTWRDADPSKKVAQGTGGFSWFLGQVRVHPEDPDLVFAMDVQLMRSTDGGASWQFFPDTPALHADHHAMAFHPQDPNYIVEGNDGGISISEDGGLSWRKVPLPVTQFYEIEIDPNHPERLYGGTQDNWVLRTLSGGTDDWERLRNAFFAGGDGFYVNVAEENSDFIYVESQFGGLQKSSDGGLRFSRIDILGGIPPLYENASSPANAEPRNWSTPFIIDPNDSAFLYCGTNRVYRSEDRSGRGTRGTVWRPISPPLTDWRRGDRLGTTTTIAVAPSNSDVIYAGTDVGRVWVTTDYGGSWREISEGLPFRWVTRVVVDPHDAATAYATFSGLKWRDRQPHVFRTRNTGATWEDITNNLPDAPVNAFAVDPFDPDVLYLGSDVGAFVSFDAGQTWEALGSGMPVVSVYDMKIDPEGRFLVAGTHGRGMYRIDLPARPTAVETAPPARRAVALRQNYPNPFDDETTIGYRLEPGAHVRLVVYDLLGRAVRTLVDAYQGAGEYAVRWDGHDGGGLPVAAGNYLYTLTTPDRQGPGWTRQLVRVR